MDDKDNACADVEECLFVGVLGRLGGTEGDPGQKTRPCGVYGGYKRACVGGGDDGYMHRSR